MPLTRPVMIVAVTDPERPDEAPAEHRIEVTPGDQFRAEFEGSRYGLSPKLHPVQITAVWAWCALTRLGLYPHGYQDFANRDLYAFDHVKGEEVAVDPTTAEQSDSACTVPTSSPAPPTGSTPTSTSGS